MGKAVLVDGHGQLSNNLDTYIVSNVYQLNKKLVYQGYGFMCSCFGCG